MLLQFLKLTCLVWHIMFFFFFGLIYIVCSKNLENALFMVGEIGGNDYNYALLQGRSFDEIRSIAPLVVQAIKDAVIVSVSQKLLSMSSICLIISKWSNPFLNLTYCESFAHVLSLSLTFLNTSNLNFIFFFFVTENRWSRCYSSSCSWEFSHWLCTNLPHKIPIQ